MLSLLRKRVKGLALGFRTVQCFHDIWQVHSSHVCPWADPCVSLLTEETPQGLVDDTLRYELDRGEISEESWVIWEPPWGYIYIIMSHVKTGKATASILDLCLRKYFVP